MGIIVRWQPFLLQPIPTTHEESSAQRVRGAPRRVLPKEAAYWEPTRGRKALPATIAPHGSFHAVARDARELTG